MSLTKRFKLLITAYNTIMSELTRTLQDILNYQNGNFERVSNDKISKLLEGENLNSHGFGSIDMMRNPYSDLKSSFLVKLGFFENDIISSAKLLNSDEIVKQIENVKSDFTTLNGYWNNITPKSTKDEKNENIKEMIRIISCSKFEYVSLKYEKQTSGCCRCCCCCC